MSDIVERLRNWRTVHLARLHLLMDEAADEMERLVADWPEQLQAHSVLIAEQELEIQRLRLTAEEREAVAYYLGTGGPYNVDRTLVALLSRTGSDAAKTADDAAECRSRGAKCPERERVSNYLEKPDSSALTDAEREPVAWAALRDDGDVAWIGYTPEGAADAACGRQIVPLYRSPQSRVVRLPALDPNGAPGWNAAIGAVREALADAGVDWDTE